MEGLAKKLDEGVSGQVGNDKTNEERDNDGVACRPPNNK
jgi:hypothetical protein